MTLEDAKALVLAIAVEVAAELERTKLSVTLTSLVMARLKLQLPPAATLADEQLFLQAWYALHREGTLVCGYDLDRPEASYYHVPPATTTGTNHASTT